MNFEERITKRSNMEVNEGLSSFMSFAAQQHHDAFGVFYNFINKVRPKKILEVGTALGGFTRFLKWVSDEIGHPIEILSLEIREMGWYDEIRKSGVDIRIENVFSDDFTSVDQSIIDFIESDGITLVLCDGGNKVGEFNVLSNYIKDGDYILAHDYGESKEIFEEKIKDKIWNWHEISYENIRESCERNNLKIHKKDEFERVVWTCWQK